MIRLMVRTMEYRPARSVRLDVRETDYLSPLLNLVRDKLSKFGGRHRHGHCTQICKLRLHLGDVISTSSNDALRKVHFAEQEIWNIQPRFAGSVCCGAGKFDDLCPLLRCLDDEPSVFRRRQGEGNGAEVNKTCLELGIGSVCSWERRRLPMRSFRNPVGTRSRSERPVAPPNAWPSPQPLGHHLVGEEIDAGHVAAGPGEAGDKTNMERVFADAEDDRDRRGCSFGRLAIGFVSCCANSLLLSALAAFISISRHAIAVIGNATNGEKRGAGVKVGAPFPCSECQA